MPLIVKRDVADATQFAIWRIEEDADWFRSQLMLNSKELELIDSIKNPQRKLHWLSSRVLVRRMMQTDQFIHLESDSRGKPVIHNFPVYISISHSGDLSALLISAKYQVGVDIEKIDPKIFRIQHKFLREEEKENLIDDKKKLEQLYVIWCAKEAMYKLYGQKQIDFRHHLFVTPFKYSEAGELMGVIKKGDYVCELSICYEKLNNYMIAYVIK